MINKIKTYCFLILLSAAVFLTGGCFQSCGRSENGRMLRDADAIVETDPDSAYRIIEKIDTASLALGKEKALFSLLDVQSRLRILKPVNDSAGISSARKYFSRNPSKDYRIRANLYSAYLLAQDSCYEKGIVNVANAYWEADKAKEGLLKARSARLISDILSECGQILRALEFDSIAAEEYLKAGKRKLYYLSQLNRVRHLAGLYDYERAKADLHEIMEELKNEPVVDANSYLLCLRTGIIINVWTKNYGTADSLNNVYHDISLSDKLSSSHLSYLAIIENSKGNFDRAVELIDSASASVIDDYDRDMLHEALISHACSTGNRKLELKALKDKNDFIFIYLSKTKNNQSVLLLDKVIESKNREYEATRNERAIFYVSLLFVLAIFFVILLIKTRKGAKKRESELFSKEKELQESENLLQLAEQRISEITRELSLLKSELTDAGGINSRMMEAIRNVYDRDLPFIKKLYETYSNFGGHISNDVDRANRLRKDLEEYFSEKRLDWFVEVVDIVKNGLVSDFKKAFPDIRESYISLFALYAAGFSTKAISIMFGVNRNALDQRKVRLRDWILASGIADKDKFLQNIYTK